MSTHARCPFCHRANVPRCSCGCGAATSEAPREPGRLCDQCLLAVGGTLHRGPRLA